MAASSASRKHSAWSNLLVGLVMAILLFGLAGTLRWWQGWAFIIVNVALGLLLSNTVFKQYPELIAERAKAGKLAPKWDRVLVLCMNITLPIMLVLSGLDKRFSWSTPSSNLVPILALTLMVMGIALTLQAMRANPFFSSHVRIQTERGHQVVNRGPYQVVRHPGYTGAILFNLGVPVLLGSRVALVVGVVFLVLTLVRTALEDRTLRQELPGYQAYAESVRYRLIPFLW